MSQQRGKEREGRETMGGRLPWDHVFVNKLVLRQQNSRFSHYLEDLSNPYCRKKLLI